MKTLVGGSACIAFLARSGTIGYSLLKDPRRLADRAERLGWWIPPLDYSRTRLGRIQLRLLGALFLLVSSPIAMFILYTMLSS
jgi:hypothetical protein